MRINLKLYASFQDRLPPGAQNNQAQVEVPAEISINQVLDRYKIPRDEAQIVLVNGVFAVDGQRDELRFNEGDTLAVWPAVAGG